MRPRLHFTPNGWMNDPIPIFSGGAYHVFYQHNPFATDWGDMHWGHAVSTDLVRWEHAPIALAPDQAYDRAGVWTGSVIEHAGRFFAFYTGISSLDPLRQTQCLATSDDLYRWTKHPANPLIESPPEGFGPCFRDPCVLRRGDEWWMVIGSQTPSGAAALLYRSDDLVHWRPAPPLYEARDAADGVECECPDLFEIGGRWALLASSGVTRWWVGRLDGGSFVPERRGACDVRGAFYAGKTLLDDGGRRILFGWIRERDGDHSQAARGWSGMLSLPRVLSLGPDGSLWQSPPAELRELRRTPAGAREGAPCFEMEATLRSPRMSFGVRVAGEPVTFEPRPREDVPLRVWVDGCVVEAFAGRREVATVRCEQGVAIEPCGVDGMIHWSRFDLDP